MARTEQKLIGVSETSCRIEQNTVEGLETSYRIELRITEMFTLLKALHNNLPKEMGYPWECGWAKEQKPVCFEDVLGRSVALPIVLCSTKDVCFHPSLN